jgi:hypothetical protein
MYEPMTDDNENKAAVINGNQKDRVIKKPKK